MGKKNSSLTTQSRLDISITDISAASIASEPRVPLRDPDDLLPLTPAIFHILLALASGECHGYGIMQQVSDLTDGQTNLGPGTLYRSIQKMVLDELIEEIDLADAKSEEPERRRVYRMTAFGRQVARAEARRLAILVRAALDRKLIPEVPAPREKGKP
jgi:DNA-binding PadR family transcriptional regulator